MRNITPLIPTLVLIAALAMLAATGCDNSETIVVPNLDPPAARSTQPAQTQATQPVRKVEVEDPTRDNPRGPFTPHQHMAQLIQTVFGLDHPKSCAPSLDGKFLFVSSTGAANGGYFPGRGYVSKFEILADGRLKPVKHKFTPGLTAPMGIAVLPRTTRLFPAGSLFVCTGMTAQTDAEGNFTDDLKKCNPGVTIISPDSGQILGRIGMGPGSGVFKFINRAILAPNGIAFDPDGNLYVGDQGYSGKYLNPPIVPQPGIIRLQANDVDAFSQNGQGPISYLSVRHEPNGMMYSALDDFLYWTTCDGQGPAGGGVWRMPRKSFGAINANAVTNVVGDVGGPLEGVAITPLRQKISDKSRWGGTLIFSRTTGDLWHITPTVLGPISYVSDDPPTFDQPGDIRIHVLVNGWVILYVPERNEASDKPDHQRLRVILMPIMM